LRPRRRPGPQEKGLHQARVGEERRDSEPAAPSPPPGATAAASHDGPSRRAGPRRAPPSAEISDIAAQRAPGRTRHHRRKLRPRGPLARGSEGPGIPGLSRAIRSSPPRRGRNPVEPADRLEAVRRTRVRPHQRLTAGATGLHGLERREAHPAADRAASPQALAILQRGGRWMETSAVRRDIRPRTDDAADGSASSAAQAPMAAGWTKASEFRKSTNAADPGSRVRLRSRGSSSRGGRAVPWAGAMSSPEALSTVTMSAWGAVRPRRAARTVSAGTVVNDDRVDTVPRRFYRAHSPRLLSRNRESSTDSASLIVRNGGPRLNGARSRFRGRHPPRDASSLAWSPVNVVVRR
jgi:hypothetical protein